MSWDRQQQRRIWVIGASTGIGHALARQLLSEGHHVALSARRTAALGELAAEFPDQELVVPCDVTRKDDISAAVRRIGQHFGGLDTVIYNAGSCEYLNDGQVDADLVERVMATNFFGLAHCLEAVMPLLKQGNAPQIAAVSSSAAYLPLPRAEAYGASKAAMSYFLHALRLDLRPHGISVNVICPGFVKTPLTDRNDFAMPCQISAEQAAAEIVAGLRRNKKEIHFPRRFTRLLKAVASLPLDLQQKLTGQLVRA
ncbi:SDR family NAD(P)-dependent oxidoreductase [Permianibacter sp. IMCC34836]|uniref:SDR family NAD(P)-dependent oxidoreductase n=1 Tax=Permianibacter fluminis TaxID=2738515 RepID=UPI001555DE4B|nr:SDR family NAD(P)-dependent oxidoreductase [Permianibacter fluminis]NQD36865.1 SDR family NAD(P)-dependent oxidoreductase [Permianibacter fluminis]